MMMDDTALFATTRERCVDKFKLLVNYCDEYGMSVNQIKTKLLVINGVVADKVDVVVGSITIKNCKSYIYLGSPITEEGTVKSVIGAHCAERKGNLQKFHNFLDAQRNLPFLLKKKVAESAVMASILYGAETWLGNGTHSLSPMYFEIVKGLLGVRTQTPNDLCLIEVGMPACATTIRNMQKRWVDKNIGDTPNPHQPLMFALELCRSVNSPMAHYIDKLLDMKDVMSDDRDSLVSQIKGRDTTRFSEYVKLNKHLCTPTFYQEWDIPEFVRISVTRFRLSSHRLKVETGRWARIPRDLRVCLCGNGIQDEHHIIFVCPFTEMINRQIRESCDGDLDTLFCGENVGIIQVSEAIHKSLNLMSRSM